MFVMQFPVCETESEWELLLFLPVFGCHDSSWARARAREPMTVVLKLNPMRTLTIHKFLLNTNIKYVSVVTAWTVDIMQHKEIRLLDELYNGSNKELITGTKIFLK